MNASQKCIMHVVTGLNVGGAERMLAKLVCASDKQRFKTVVVSLTGEGVLGKIILDCNVKVYSLEMTQGKISFAALLQLSKLIKQIQPDLIMAWMYHSNIAVLCANLLSFWGKPMLWNIRHTPYDMSKEKKLTSILIRLGAKLSFIPKYVVFNSNVSLKWHKQLGFREDKSIVIPNGFDTDIFKASAQVRKKSREVLEIPETIPVLAHVARFHPMKDHKGFVHAASLIAENDAETKFVLIGRDVSWENELLVEWIDSYSLRDRVLLLDERSDLQFLFPAFDVLCLSSSWGEGFPNVIGEAMACGLPCVTTDVGDSAIVVGDTGCVVQPDDPKALAQACIDLLECGYEQRQILGDEARIRIEKNYSLDAIVTDYQSLYEKTLM